MVQLTRREREVAELLAQGLTNREIAERLFIGVRTAEFHVDQLRNKLGVRSRAHIAALWVEQRNADGAAPDSVRPPMSVLAPPQRYLALGTYWLRWRKILGAASLAALALLAGLLTWPRIQTAQPPEHIQTFAGVGVESFSGDGGPARKAALREPSGIAVDSAGAVYVATDGRIRRIARDGVISTVAGSGSFGSSGDGGAAALAQIGVGGKWGNTGVAVDRDGALYIPDSYGHRIRLVTPAGIISTIAGTGAPGDSGDGGPAETATLTMPRGIAVDDRGDVFVAEAGGHRVRRIDHNGLISTYAGTGEPGIEGEGGPATAAQLNGPEAVALDKAGNLFIADTVNNRIRRVALDGSITTVAGNGAYGYSGDGGRATKARLALPRGLATDSRGFVYIADSDNNRVRRVDAAGVITTIAGTGKAGYSGDGDSPLRAQLNEPDGVAVDGAGQVYIADAGNQRVRVVPG